jgi:NADH/NAD ratio-sensing transcriptional regulator Rex
MEQLREMRRTMANDDSFRVLVIGAGESTKALCNWNKMKQCDWDS